ncbi:MAG: SDR family NAD(P)-dependent oxidoreductase [Sandaracinaceae bacterium]
MRTNKRRPSARLAEGAWLVTGAASGFGREVARRLLEGGRTVVALDRDAAALEGLAAADRSDRGTLIRLTADVTDPAAVRAALDRAAGEGARIAHVFHSAGVLAVGPAETLPASEYRRMIEVNFLGSVHVAQAAIPALRDSARTGRATLTFVASVAGLRGFPELAGYSASKFAVVGFAQALRDELAESGVAVRVLCPPPGDTPMVRNLAKVPPIYKLSPLFSATEVIDAYFAGLEAQGWIALVDLRSKALWRVGRFAPWILDAVVRRAT